MHSKEDSIEELSLSVRATNGLLRNGINTIEELLLCPKHEIKNLRSIGAKVVYEIVCCINKIEDGLIVIYDIDGIAVKPKPTCNIDGIEYYDEEINSTIMSVRAYNCLKHEGYNMVSEILSLSELNIYNIRNLGSKTIKEIITLISNYKLRLVENSEVTMKNAYINKLTDSLYKKFNLNTIVQKKDFFYNLKKIFEDTIEIESYITDFDCENVQINRTLYEKIMKTSYINSVIKKYILSITGESNFGMSSLEIYSLLNIFSISDEEVDIILLSLLNDQVLLFENDMYKIKLNSFTDGIESIFSGKELTVFNNRVNGKTLEQVGEILGVTRERVRQLEVKLLRKLDATNIKFAEDKYFLIYKKYDITKDIFVSTFKDEKLYNYITMRCGKDLSKVSREELFDILDDETIPIDIRILFESYFNKDKVRIGNDLIHCSRNNLISYIVRKNAIDEVHIEYIKQKYDELLIQINKNDVKELRTGIRYFESRVSSSNFILWKYGKKCRYYNIQVYDFDSFIEELSLEQFENIEISTRKLFKTNIELMKEYDIRDEYELHNLLKKISTKYKLDSVNFIRMPNLEFGQVSREEQVHNLLIRNAPIAYHDFSKLYEEEYGVDSSTVQANYLSTIECYLHDGVYTFETPSIPEDICEFLTKKLTSDIYEISYLLEEIKMAFPDYNSRHINFSYLKNLGYKVYPSCILKNTYDNISQYFDELFKGNELINIEKFPKFLRNFYQFSNSLYKIKSKYTIVEYLPNNYISYSKLNKNGIDLNRIEKFCDDVACFVHEDQYFTITSLLNEEFSLDMEDYGFDNWFFSSLLCECKDKFTYLRIGGTKLFTKKSNISFSNFIEEIIFHSERLSMEIDDLQDYLQKQYGIFIDNYRLIEIAKNTSLYYDTISKKIFADYDVYYEEV